MKNLISVIFVLFMAFFPGGAIIAQTCPNGLISYWKFDDVSNDLIKDFFGNHNAHAETGLATEAEGKVGGAKFFDGTSILIVDNDTSFSFDSNSSFSIEFWIKYSELVGIRGNIIIGKNDPASGGSYWSVGLENPSGKLFFDLKDGSGNLQTVVSNSSVSKDAWHHVVAVRNDSTGENILYLDGVPGGTAVNYNYPGNFISDGDINIGFQIRQGVPDYFYKGVIDEAAIYHVALSPANVNEHFSKNNFGIGNCDGFSPSFISNPVTTGVVGQPYTYAAKATGLPTMVYSLVTAPAGMTINSSTGVISWTPDSINNNGIVTVRADNDVAPADTQTFIIYLADTPVCPDGILALWKLNETSGPTYVDYYTDHTITATVAPTAVAGKLFGGQVFNAGTLLNIPDNGNEFEWTNTSDFSFEFWMKTLSSETMVVFGRSQPHAEIFWIGLTGGKATFSLRDSSAKEFQITGQSSLDDNLWHQVIAVREGSTQTNKLFVDGVLEDSVSTDYTGSFTCNEPCEINLGWFNNTASGFHFVGALDEVAIFSTAISETEAASFFNDGDPAGHCAIDNYAPFITSVPLLDAFAGNPYSYTLTASDINNPQLVFSAVEIPTWLTFNGSTGELTGTPAQGDKGQHQVILRASDGSLSADQKFTITVDAPEGLEDLSAAGIYIYPVPAADYLTVKIGFTSEAIQLELINTSGSILRKVNIPANQPYFRLDLNGIETGIYYLHLRNSSINHIGRFIKIK